MQEFKLDGSPFIQLNQLLKAAGVVYSGGEAKMLISEGQVLVNSEMEHRLRRKIVTGDVVKVGDTQITVQ